VPKFVNNFCATAHETLAKSKWHLRVPGREPLV